MTTSAVGSLLSTTVKLALPPASVVTEARDRRHVDARRVVVAFAAATSAGRSRVEGSALAGRSA
jgi:hypothetical protein